MNNTTKAQITTELKRFVQAYTLFNELGTLTYDEVVTKINRGDCGLAAITVHHILKEKYGIETDILLCSNHCWLAYRETEYDTLCPLGYTESVVSRWGVSPDERVTYLSFKDACEGWMPCDALGAYIVKTLCAITGVAFPPELQHCLDNADEYEMPGVAAQYEAKSQLTQSLM